MNLCFKSVKPEPDTDYLGFGFGDGADLGSRSPSAVVICPILSVIGWLIALLTERLMLITWHSAQVPSDAEMANGVGKYFGCEYLHRLNYVVGATQFCR